MSQDRQRRARLDVIANAAALRAIDGAPHLEPRLVKDARQLGITAIDDRIERRARARTAHLAQRLDQRASEQGRWWRLLLQTINE